MLSSLTEPLVPTLGDGSDNNPYQISNLANLRWLSETISVWGDTLTTIYFEQTQHIDAQESDSWNNGKGFHPIGQAIFDNVSVQNTPFYGVYDGNGYSVLNLYQRPDNTIMKAYGMFGSIENAVIRNLAIENADIENNYMAGIVAGKVISSVIEKIQVSGSVSSTNLSAGCIALADDSTINNIAAFITLSVEDNGGGIVSLLRNSSLEDSYFFGTLNGSLLGGLVNSIGYNSIVKNSYFAGTINGDFSGLVANTIHPLGSVESVVAVTEQNIPLFNTPNGEQINTSIISIEQLQNFSFLENIGWSFETIWGIDYSINDGFPYLLWQTSLHTANNDSVESLGATGNINNFPNPFNPETTISFYNPQRGKVNLSIYNIKGQLVKTLIDEETSAGPHSLVWKGKDERGKSVASGIYFTRIKTDKSTQIKKMILMK